MSEGGREYLMSELAHLLNENTRLRQACIQVRTWGIELASLPPELRERRFAQLWPRINDTLRTALLQQREDDNAATLR